MPPRPKTEPAESVQLSQYTRAFLTKRGAYLFRGKDAEFISESELDRLAEVWAEFKARPKPV